MKKTVTFSKEVMEASGTIAYNMTNDYMFRSVLQTCEPVLRGLISSMLHIPPEEILDVGIDNPIMLGENIEDKTFVLDVKVILNGNMRINLEMQVANTGNWENRSLSYLCRNFDHLCRGQDYRDVAPVVHIGFLDFDLFEGDREFYSSYKVINEKTGRVYNSNFLLNVLYLQRTDLATEEDRLWGIDKWAKLFKAGTWEELRMIACEDETLRETAERIFINCSDETFREYCRRRQDAIDHEKWVEKKLKELAGKDAKIADMDAILADKNAELADKNAELADMDAILADKNAELADKDTQLARQQDQIEKMQEEIERLKNR